MAKSNKKYFTTEVGTMAYPFLFKPDDGAGKDFKMKPTFKVDLTLNAEENAELLAAIDAATDAQFELAKSRAKNGEELLRSAPYDVLTDDDGDETGEVYLRFKMLETIEMKDPKDSFTQKPTLYDLDGEFTGDAIWGGSKGAVNFWMQPYTMPGKKKPVVTPPIAGVSLKLRAVQVTEVVSGGGATAESCGFKVSGKTKADQAMAPSEPNADGNKPEENSDDF